MHGLQLTLSVNAVLHKEEELGEEEEEDGEEEEDEEEEDEEEEGEVDEEEEEDEGEEEEGIQRRSSACAQLPPCLVPQLSRQPNYEVHHEVQQLQWLRRYPRRVGSGKHCSPRHRMPFGSSIEGRNCMWMTWRDIAQHDTGCHRILASRAHKLCG